MRNKERNAHAIARASGARHQPIGGSASTRMDGPGSLARWPRRRSGARRTDARFAMAIGPAFRKSLRNHPTRHQKLRRPTCGPSGRRAGGASRRKNCLPKKPRGTQSANDELGPDPDSCHRGCCEVGAAAKCHALGGPARKKFGVSGSTVRLRGSLNVAQIEIFLIGPRLKRSRGRLAMHANMPRTFHCQICPACGSCALFRSNRRPRMRVGGRPDVSQEDGIWRFLAPRVSARSRKS